jgi:hypothetical protein
MPEGPDVGGVFTVVLHWVETDRGMSLVNSVEQAAAAVARLMSEARHGLPVGETTWVIAPEHEGQEWLRVAFGSCERDESGDWRFGAPAFSECGPVEPDEWRLVEPEEFYATEWRPIGPDERVELRLNAEDCYKVRTGTCSLDAPAPLDGADGEAGWRHCRELADLASLWLRVKDELTEDRKGEVQGAKRVALSARRDWRAPYGTISRVKEADIVDVHRLYRRLAPNAAQSEHGTLDFSDGQHRWCSSRHAGLDLPVRVNFLKKRLTLPDE